jgi:ABC-type uncharacterized transport system involved in gliding motility auxiliary subunit
VVFLLDAITLNEQMGLTAYPAQSGFEEILTAYGVNLKSSLVLDARNSTATFSQGFMAFTVPYPYWPRLSRPDLDSQNPVTSRLESLTLPWTAPLEVRTAIAVPGGGTQEPADPSPQPDVTATILGRSTNKAWVQSGRYDLNPQAILTRPATPTGEQYPLAVSLTGKFQSAFAGKPVPPKPGAADGAVESPLTESPLTQVLVVGNSQFCSNLFLHNFPENVLFLQNAIDWMTLGGDLISIRSRGATARPLREIPTGARTAVKLALTAGIPALVILVGVARATVRRRQRNRLVEIYGPTH